MVECHLAKVDVEGSNPFSRSILTPDGALRARRAFGIFRASVFPVLRPLRSASKRGRLRGLRTGKSESPAARRQVVMGADEGRHGLSQHSACTRAWDGRMGLTRTEVIDEGLHSPTCAAQGDRVRRRPFLSFEHEEPP